MRPFLVFLLPATMCAGSAVAAPAFQTSAPIAYMVDMSSGAVLFNKQSEKKIAPASMTKMLTAYVVFDMITNGELKPSQHITVKPEIWTKWRGVGSTMFLKANEKVSVADLLRGLITLSGNDAAVALAAGIDGSEGKFVQRMNRTAKRLGMTSSYFGTPNGWPDEGRTLTTAHDLSVLGARTVHDFPILYRQFYGLREFRWSGVTQPNRDPLLGAIPGADGLKTGHTEEAGYCFTGSAVQGGRRLMMVLAGLPSFQSRTVESVRFMQWGFENWRSIPLYKSGLLVANVPVQLGDASQIKAIAPRDLAVTLPRADGPKYRLIVRYSGPVKAPIKKGSQIAELVVRFSDKSEQIMPLIAANDVGEAGFFQRAWNGAKSLVGA